MKHSIRLYLLYFLSLSAGLPVTAQDTSWTEMKIETRQFAKESGYNLVLSEALSIQLKSDSLGRIARDKRLLAKVTPDEGQKKYLIADIIRLERESKKLQREADLKFAEAWKMKEAEASPAGGDTGTVENIPSMQPSNVSEADKEISDEFSLLDKSYYNESNPIPKGLNSHKGLVYRIQLGVFSKPRVDDAFGGISPVYYHQVENSAILKYYAGLFYTLKGALTALGQVKINGFPDAFIVAFFDDKPITTEKAREIEFANLRL